MSQNNFPAKIVSMITEYELEFLIIDCYPVRRPLYIPSTVYKIGEVLSHSSVVCVTSRGTYIIEYMCDSIVYIKKLEQYESGVDFDFDDSHFIHDDRSPQHPCRAVTIRRFSISMANYMEGKKFNTFTHNCHMARYLTMKKYGMTSNNPKKAKRNIFFQGFVDFFSRSKSLQNATLLQNAAGSAKSECQNESLSEESSERHKNDDQKREKETQKQEQANSTITTTTNAEKGEEKAVQNE